MLEIKDLTERLNEMKIIKDIPYVKDAVSDQVLDIYLPDKDEFDVFVYIHGGGIENGDKNDGAKFGEFLADKGTALVSINYRMYPTAAYPDFIKDSAAAVAWTKENMKSYGKVKNFFIGGSSAGGYISMMLCFDKKWLAPHGIAPDSITGYIHDAGQPTAHFNVLREQGIDSRRVIIDDTAPLYYIGTAEKYAPMLFIVSDNDIQNRYEQTKLTISTMKHFGYDLNNVELKEMQGRHCAYVGRIDEDGLPAFGKIAHEYIEKFRV